MSEDQTRTGPDPLELLRRMALIRRFEAQAEKFMDRGQILGAIHSSAGQEAVAVGACAALRGDDYMTGHHRSHGHPIAKGAGLEGLFAELLGRVTGVCHGNGGSMHLADFSVGSLGESAIVGSSLAIAAGAGLAINMAGEDRVCLAFFGDGAANTGVFHESLNLAAVWNLPVVFVCENNQYAVSTRHSDVCSVDQIAQRAAAYGIPGSVVDGQTVLDVHDAVSSAVERARSGHGPSIVEAMTYRYDAHSYRLSTLGDRTEEEVEFWRSRDPINLFADFMVSENIASQEQVDQVLAEADVEVSEAATSALKADFPTRELLAADMYAMPLRRHTPEVLWA